MSCVVTCGGFQSLRSECISNACLGNAMCFAVDPTIPTSMTCAQWCCQSNMRTVAALVLLFCSATFLALLGLYLYRLHVINVRNKAGEIVMVDAPSANPRGK